MAQNKLPMSLQIGHDSFIRNTNMPIAQTTKRAVQSAKQQRDCHSSVHHVRQMEKLATASQLQQTREKCLMLMKSPGGPMSTFSTRTSAVSTLDAKKQLENAFTIRSSTATALSPVARPLSSGAFKPRKIEPTRFRYFCEYCCPILSHSVASHNLTDPICIWCGPDDRGDLPLRVNFAGAVRKLQWRVDITKLDYSHYLPMFMEGLRDLDEPYHFLALNGTLDLLDKGENRTLACLPLLILPMKQNLMTRNHTVLCLQMKVLQKMVLCCPYVGEALVPYYRQLLSIFNLFITKRVNCGDAIDYGQRRQENLGDLILETLNLLESHGGPDAFVNIKYVRISIPELPSYARPPTSLTSFSASSAAAKAIAQLDGGLAHHPLLLRRLRAQPVCLPELQEVNRVYIARELASSHSILMQLFIPLAQSHVSRDPDRFLTTHVSILILSPQLRDKASAMKKRPVLTLLANEDELRAPSKPRDGKPRLCTARSNSDDDSEEEIDELENSCDIGETTLRKGPIHINRTGVTFVSKHEEEEVPDEMFYQPKRKVNPCRATAKEQQNEGSPLTSFLCLALLQLVTLEELETCGLIGRGCSGHVMKAKHHRTDALYAVKLVNNVHDKAKRDQMLTEIRTLYSVESPYLVDFYGAYFKDHALSIVLEYCEAGSLDKIIQQRAAIPERVIAAMAFQMLQGLYHLKQTHHFHRDIKPQNILAKSNGKIKLTDFGIARELGNSQDMAQTFVGTFKYMSPERVQNQPYDYKSDIWSLGLVLIECATKEFPYLNARSYIDVVQSIIECPEPTLPEDGGGDSLSFSEEFRSFLSACLQKNPQKRSSVQELLHSPWLKLHNATDGLKCVRTCAEWFASFCSSKRREAKGTSEDEDNYDDDEYEIEEDIDAK